MNNKSKELENILITIKETSERDIDELSDSIDKIIECHITNERTISLIFDTILSIEFIEDDKKIKVFHKLSNYCRSFNEELADDYDRILEQDLNYDYDEEWNDDLEYETVPWFDEGMKQFKSNDREYLKSKIEFRNFFLKVKKEVQDFPKLNELSKEELQNNHLFGELSYLAIRFFNEIMTDDDFRNLKYSLKRIKKYGEEVLKDMFEYYTNKYEK